MSFPLFKNLSFFNFLINQFATHLGFQMIGVGIGWQIYDLTNDPFALGLVGLYQFLPQLILILVTGQVADKYNRRLISIIASFIMVISCLILVFTNLNTDACVGIIYFSAVLLGIARSFQMPATQAILPNLVKTSQLSRALSVRASIMQLAIIVGPVIGGLVYLLGPISLYGLSAFCFLISAIALFFVSYNYKEKGKTPFTIKNLFGGFSFIKGNKVVFGAISLDMFAVLLGGAVALLPIVAKDILQTDAWGLGLLRSAPAVGALVMSIYLAKKPLKNNVGKNLFASVIFFGIFTLIFGLSTNLLLSIIALFFLGLFDMVSVVIRSSLVQIETPDAMRGRVSAVNSVFIGSSNQLGEFESGVTAAWFGTVPAIIVGGIGTIVIAGLWMRLFPSLLKRETLEK